MRLPQGGTGFEELIPPAQAPPPPEGKYILEACEPGAPLSSHRVDIHADRARAGDLVLIHGSVLHKSEKNRSPATRFAYTFHMVESAPYAAYDGKNWLQPTAALPFSRVLESANASVHPATGRA